MTALANLSYISILNIDIQASNQATTTDNKLIDVSVRVINRELVAPQESLVADVRRLQRSLANERVPRVDKIGIDSDVATGALLSTPLVRVSYPQPHREHIPAAIQVLDWRHAKLDHTAVRNSRAGHSGTRDTMQQCRTAPRAL